MPKPTVGRIVHYHQHPFMGTEPPTPTPLAALIVAVSDHPLLKDEWAVDLHVFYPTETRKGRGVVKFIGSVVYSPEPKYGCWSWPPREGA
jgi:hypothetical protein